MAKSNEEVLEERVAAAAVQAIETVGPLVQRLTIDFQANGELPFRMEVPNETLPLIGLARVNPERLLQREQKVPVAERETQGQTHG